MSQYDLFGDAAQVGGLRCLDAAVGGRAAERLPVEHEVVDAGFQVGAVDRLVLIVGVVEVGESAVAAGREGPGLFENDFAGGRFRPNFVRQCRAVGSY